MPTNLIPTDDSEFGSADARSLIEATRAETPSGFPILRFMFETAPDDLIAGSQHRSFGVSVELPGS
jgi:hypothetical protein